jgi:hypothetical protein
MERLERAGNDAVMTPEPTDVPRSAWGTIDPEIRPKYPAPTFTKKSKFAEVYEEREEKLTRKGRVGRTGF